jgi:DNA-binding IclR family transcriptional regulator
MNSPSKSETYQVPALERALSILELLAQHSEGIRMREIADRLGLPSNSVFRITGTLEDRGYLIRDGEDMRYRLSRKLLALGYAAVGEDKLTEHSLDVMRTLRDETHETVLVGIRDDLEGLVLEQVASTQPIKFLVAPGTRFPLHTAAPGKAVIAYLPKAERESVLQRITYTRYNERTLDSREKFEADLLNVTADGYGLDRGEQIEGLHCVAAPIFDHRGYPFAALWLTGPSFRFPATEFEKTGKLVASAAHQISQRFGYNLL